jgi:hypothetical protein
MGLLCFEHSHKIMAQRKFYRNCTNCANSFNPLGLLPAHLILFTSDCHLCHRLAVEVQFLISLSTFRVYNRRTRRKHFSPVRNYCYYQRKLFFQHFFQRKSESEVLNE